MYLSPGSARRLSEKCAPAEAKPSVLEDLLLLPCRLALPRSAGPTPLGTPRIQLGASKRAGCAAEVASGALSASSEALLRSSSARCASQERSRCVLGSILGPSGPQNLCSRQGESLDFRKSAFPLSIFILGSKSPLKVTSWTPKWRSRRAQSTSRALPEAIRDAFWLSLGVSWSAPGCPGAVLERSGKAPHLTERGVPAPPAS